MKATVGPLPPAVYWRRRAIVIGALVVLVILLVATCSGGGNKSTPNARRSGSGSNGPSTASSSPAVLPPIVGESAAGDGGGGDGGDTNPTPTAGSGDNAGNGDNGGGQQQASVGGCADSDLGLTAEATPLAGGGYHFLMKVKNTSNHACTRDVGGGPQELVVTGPSGSWTSNSCATPGATPAPDVRTFQPGVEAVLPAPGKPFTWDGSINKCSGGTKAGAGTYHLVAKLATKASDPVTVAIGK